MKNKQQEKIELPTMGVYEIVFSIITPNRGADLIQDWIEAGSREEAEEKFWEKYQSERK